MYQVISIFIKIIILFIACGGALDPVYAQRIDNSGDCNANISGSGNNVTIRCSGRSDDSEAVVRLVVGSSGRQTIFGNINPQFVNPKYSSISVEIDDEYIASADLTEALEDEFFERPPGEYFYSIDLDITYLNGLSENVSCKGVLRMYASAEIIPVIQVLQNQFTGDLFAQRCGFTIR